MASERTSLLPTVFDNDEQSRREKGLMPSSDRQQQQPSQQLGSHSLIGLGTITLLLAVAAIIATVQSPRNEADTPNAMPTWCIKIPPEKRKFVPACRGDTEFPPSASGSLAVTSSASLVNWDVDLVGKPAAEKKDIKSKDKDKYKHHRYHHKDDEKSENSTSEDNDDEESHHQDHHKDEENSDKSADNEENEETTEKDDGNDDESPSTLPDW